jgi:phage gp29-like protein
MADQNSNNKPTTKGLGAQLGQSGTTRFHGIIVGEEYNVKLSNHITANRIYDQMRRSDATVRSTLQVCKLPILSSQWDIEAASDDKQDQYIADFVKFQLFNHNLNWHDFLREGLTFFEFGHAVAEKTYELTEHEGQTRIGIKSIGYRKQRSIQAWQTKEGQDGITQQLIGDTVSIPMEKLIVFVNDKEGDNLEGISLLRYAFKHWDIKDKLDIINAIALERLAMGIPIIKKPADADEADLAKARAAARNLRANEESFMEMPVGWDAEMMDMKANGTKDVIPTIQYHDRQIQLSVLAQFLSLGGTSASGSRAVSEDHSKLFLLSEEAVAKNIQATIQEQLIKQLCDLNFTQDKLPNGYPKLTFSKIGDEDTIGMADSVQKLMSAGAITYDPYVEDHIRKLLRLPDLPEETIKSFEQSLKDQEKARKEAAKNGTTPADPNKTATGTNLPDENAAADDLTTEKGTADPEKQKTAVAASAINEARAAKRKLIDIVLAD